MHDAVPNPASRVRIGLILALVLVQIIILGVTVAGPA